MEPSRQARPRPLTVALSAPTLAIGVFVGSQLGNQARTGEMGDLGAAIVFGLGLFALAFVAVVAAVAWLIGRPATRRLAVSLAVAAIAYVGGGFVAYLATAALGRDDRQPVVRDASG